ncbi:WD40-repeat-containing domain protein [Spinellus fusiger]|nr:WD40-repeat-containing domain protein [Spinellus fusiger]
MLPTTSNNRVIPLTCSGHTRPVVDLHFSPTTSDGKCYFISACKDGSPMLRDGITGDWIGTFQGHKGAVWSARLTNEAHRAVTGSADFTAKVWDTFTGDVLHSFPHQHIVRAVDFSMDGTKVVTGGNEEKLRVFDLYRPEACPIEIEGHTGAIKAVVWDEKRNVIMSASDDKTIRRWDLRTMREISRIDCESPVSTMTLSNDKQYVTWAAGKTANFLKVDGSSDDIKTYKTEKNLSSISLHPDHTKFVAGSAEDLWARIYGFENGDELEVYKGHHGPIHTVSYSPDGEIYATGSEDGTIRLWQTTPNKPYGLWQKDDSDA